MILIIGGAYQGKLAYAKALFPKKTWEDGASCTFEALYTCEGLYHFQAYIRRMLKAGLDVSQLAGRLKAENPHIVIISNEVGYGLVPADPFDRNCREMTGRVCTELAGFARRVDRVVCGVGITIKGGHV